MKSLKSSFVTSVLISSLLLPAISPVANVLAAVPTNADTTVQTDKSTNQQASVPVAKPVSARGYAVENTTTVDLSQMNAGFGATTLPDGFAFKYSIGKDGVSSKGYLVDQTGTPNLEVCSLLGDSNYIQANTTMQYFVKIGSTWHLRALKFVNTQATTGMKDFYFDTTDINQAAINDVYGNTIKETIAPGVEVYISATANKDVVQTATVEYQISLSGNNVPDFDLDGNNNHDGYVADNGRLNQDTTFTFSYFNEQGKMMTGVLHFKKDDVKPVAKPVTVNYVDDQGQKLADSTTLTGAIGASYQATAKTIAGYELTATPTNAKGTFTDQAQTVNFVYKKTTTTPETAKPVTVKYVDEQGQTIATSETLTGKLNEAYQTTAKEITGYELVKTPSNATGQYSVEAQTVVYEYHKTAVANTAVKVTAQYVDEQGKALIASISKTGHTGDAYEAKAATISGYELIEMPNNAKGTLGTEAVNIKFVYRKTDDQTGNNNNNKTNSSNSKPGHLVTNQKKQPVATKKTTKKLPQTGSEMSIATSAIGSLMVMVVGVMYFFKKVIRNH